jgi:hypothetical protein
VIASTRILEELTTFSQTFLNHSTYLFAFRLACLRSALLARVRNAYFGIERNPLVEAEMQRDVNACMALLERYAMGSPVGATLLSVAQKMLRGEVVETGEFGASAYAADVNDLNVEGDVEAVNTGTSEVFMLRE